MASRVIVYTTEYCPFCMRAKDLLKRRGVDFREIPVSIDDEEKWDELEKKSGMKTMPQIFLDETLVGGFTELAALDQKDQLASLK